jgi:hypothetical protein
MLRYSESVGLPKHNIRQSATFSGSSYTLAEKADSILITSDASIIRYLLDGVTHYDRIVGHESYGRSKQVVRTRLYARLIPAAS